MNHMEKHERPEKAGTPSDKENIVDMEKTGANLKALFHGMSLTEVADKLSVSISTASYWTSGKKVPSIYHLAMISKLFGCKIDDIVAIKEETATDRELFPEEEN